MKLIVRLLAFFGKELNEIRRQPRLLLSLLVGPFLILLLFGIGYRGQNPTLRVALVVPEALQNDEAIDRVQQVLEDNYNLVYEGPDQDTAMQLLSNGQVDMVEVLPANYRETIRSGERAPLEFIYNEINPQTEQYLQFTAFTQIDALNQVFVMESVQQLQEETASLNDSLDSTRAALDQLEQDPDQAQNDPEVQDSVRSTSETLALLAVSPALAALAASNSDIDSTVADDMLALSEDLDALDQSMSADDAESQQDRISEIRSQLDTLDDVVTQLNATPSAVFAAPLEQQYTNVQGRSLDLMKYFAPGVAVLILQHIAVTLGALSLVRERYRGSFEFFGVAPVSLLQVILGKYLAYILYVGIITAGLIGLMIWPLNVPFLGDPWVFVGFTALFLVSSIGMGFLISVLSNSDTQAVQLAMLVLLLSIFFSGFILPLENFTAPVSYVGYIVPMTHAMTGYQDMMLAGAYPGLAQWIGLGALAVVTFILILIVGYPQFRRLRT